MDIVSHAGWGYAVLRGRGKKEAWIGAVCGAGPDLLAFTPSFIHHALNGGLRGDRPENNPEFWRTPGPLPPEMQYVYDHYYRYSHSLVLLAAVAVVLWAAGKRSWLWFCLPYALHILMDIPTHVRFQTPFLFPLSSWTFQGVSWSEPWIFWPNWILLIAALIYVRRRAARA